MMSHTWRMLPSLPSRQSRTSFNGFTICGDVNGWVNLMKTIILEERERGGGDWWCGSGLKVLGHVSWGYVAANDQKSRSIERFPITQNVIIPLSLLLRNPKSKGNSKVLGQWFLPLAQHQETHNPFHFKCHFVMCVITTIVNIGMSQKKKNNKKQYKTWNGTKTLREMVEKSLILNCIIILHSKKWQSVATIAWKLSWVTPFCAE